MTEDDVKTRLMQAALLHVPFDGWSEAAFRAACADASIDSGIARVQCPRGALDLAVAYHKAGDAVMLDRLRRADLREMRFRDRVVFAVRARLEAVEDKEVVRRGTTLFALPQHAAEGAKLIWGTADAIWTALGDGSEDLNWYSKRAILSGVYASTVLYWLGDDSPGHQATWDFLDRRIGDVMALETVKAKLRENPLTRPLMAGQDWLAARVRKPSARRDMPGSWGGFGTGDRT